MEHSTLGISSRKQEDEGEFNLREWSLKAKISREKTNSRRYSASYIRSFREDLKSFKSNIVTSSSTTSSPNYTLKEEIDPSTYSFSTALKALQAKTSYSWEYMSPDGLSLNSKWNEAEKYICNPYSGEVPLECLSSKTLSERSFRKMTSKITFSAPLTYDPSQIQTRQFQTKHHVKSPLTTHEVEIQIPNKEKKEVSITRDIVGTQSNNPVYISSSSPSPAPTLSIEESSIKQCEEADYSPMTSPKPKYEEKVGVKEDTKRNEEGLKKKVKQICKKSGCFSWKILFCISSIS